MRLLHIENVSDLLTVDTFVIVFHVCALLSAQDGKTAFDLAKQQGKDDVVQLIEVRFALKHTSAPHL